jgi:chromosome segregation protein
MVKQKAHQNELQNRLNNLNRSQESLTLGITKAGEEIKAIQENLETKLSIKNLSDEKVKATIASIEKLRKEISSVEEEEKARNAEIAKLTADSSRVNAQIKVLDQAQSALVGMSEGAKNLIVAAQSGKFHGKMNAVNSLLEVPVNLEIAISSALGDQLDGVVLEANEDPDAVLDWLDSSDSGRAILFPTGQKRTFDKINKVNDPGVVGIAADLVKTKTGDNSLLTLLLGNVLIVSDRATAKKLANALPVWGKLVTLKGEVFSGNGVIVAGKEKRSGLISRQRERQDLEGNLERINRELTHQEGLLQAAQNELEDLVANRVRLEEQLNIQKREQSDSQTAHDVASRNLIQLTQKLEWQNSQVRILDEQIIATKQELINLEEELSEGNKQAQGLNGKLQDTGNTLKEFPVEEMQTEVVHWNTTLALNERAVRDHERRISELTLTISQNTTSLSGLRKKIEDIHVMIKGAVQEGEEKRSQEAVINQEISALQSQIDPAEKELSTIENQYAVLQQGYSQAQQVETNADRVYSQAHLDMTRSREALESLRRKIEEDFGLVALEYSEDISGPTPLPLEGVKTLVTLTEIPRELEESINRQRSLLRRIGAINPEAKAEYQEVKERYEFMTSQASDLQKADADLRQVIAELDEIMQKQFKSTFNAVASEFKELFTRLFGGGSAKLVMTNEEDLSETGIDIEAKLPGRREQGLSLLSGGERSLTAVALIFSLLKVSPTPFCVLDEVDAMLDEANVGRFTELLKELSQETQFIVITHNRNTVQVADVIYGVTMGRDSSSQVVSLRLDELSEEMVN